MDNEQPEEEQGPYSHTDIYACAFMMAQGIELLKIEKLNDFTCRFIMDCEMVKGQALYIRYRGNELVGVIKYKHAYKEIKDALYNFKNNV